MRAINQNSFIERLPMEKTYGGIDISDKACVKNHIGIVRYSANKKFVGKEVHVPHFGVLDVEIDGKEYAHTKESNFFAIKDGSAFHPINGYVKIRKCVNDHIRDESGEIALYMTENHIEETHWVEVLEVAEDCKYVKTEHIGLFLVAPEESNKLARIGYTSDFCIHESLVQFLTTGD